MWGGDFAHQSGETYSNLDLIIESLNQYKHTLGQQYNIQHSTITRYFNYVYTEAKRDRITWKIESGDFWAYNYKSKPGAYWTGYFSSGPEIKHTIRQYSDYA